MAKKVVKKVSAEEKPMASKPQNKDFMAKCAEKYKPYSMIGLRLVVGFIFLIAGASKFGWIGNGSLDGVAGFFSSLGIPMAGFFAVLVAFIEFFGGLAIIVGAATRLSAALLGIIMIVAILTAHISNGWQDTRYPLLLLASLVALKINGATKWSLWPKW